MGVVCTEGEEGDEFLGVVVQMTRNKRQRDEPSQRECTAKDRDNDRMISMETHKEVSKQGDQRDTPT